MHSTEHEPLSESRSAWHVVEVFVISGNANETLSLDIAKTQHKIEQRSNDAEIQHNIDQRSNDAEIPHGNVSKPRFDYKRYSVLLDPTTPPSLDPTNLIRFTYAVKLIAPSAFFLQKGAIVAPFAPSFRFSTLFS